MGSNFFGSDHRGASNSSNSSSQSSSSRKGKKNGGGSDKPKQPQRGLGVAQLEKIRLHSQLGCNFLPNPYHHHAAAPNQPQEDIRLQSGYPAPPSSSSFGYSSSSSPYPIQTTQGVMMGFQDLDRQSIRYVDSQSTNVARWHPGNVVYGSQQSVQPSITRPFFEPEGSLNNKNHWYHDSMGSGGQNSESSNTEIDLELRL